MKKTLTSMATLALVALGLSITPIGGGSALAAPDDPVTFNDPVVESAVRYRLKLEDTEVITESKLAELRSLDFWTPEEGTREITDLTGLEKAVNLSEVVVESAKWSLLKDLPPSVTSIWLMSVKGKPDFAGFPDHLVNLTELTIKDTDITSFKQLPSRYFDQITTLDLEVVEIPNLCDPSSEFTKFNSLENLTATPVLQFGEGRTYASEVESLFGYPSPDISCLSKYDLKSLDISYNKIADVTLLSSMQNLSELNIKGNTISDLSPLKSLSALNECSAYSQGRLLNELDFKRTVSERTFSLDPVIDRNGQPVPFDVNPYGFYEEERPVIPGLSRLIQNEDGTFTFADDSSNKAVIEFSNSDDPGEVPEGDCWFTGTILIEHVEDATPGDEPVAPGDAPVTFNDPRVEKTVRKELNLSDSEPITESKILNLTSLSIRVVSTDPEDAVQPTDPLDLTGLDKATNLNEIDSWFEFTAPSWDILSSLPLERFSVTYAPSDPAGFWAQLGKLPSTVSNLSINAAGLTSFEGMPSHFNNLTELDLTDNEFRDWVGFPAPYFESIETLGIQQNRFENLCAPESAFRNFSNLQSLNANTFLAVGDFSWQPSKVDSYFGSAPHDLSCLDSLALDSLQLAGNDLSEIPMVAQTRALSTLVLVRNKITDFSPVNATNLTESGKCYFNGQEFDVNVSERIFTLPTMIDMNGANVPYILMGEEEGPFAPEHPELEDPPLSYLERVADGKYRFVDAYDDAYVTFNESWSKCGQSGQITIHYSSPEAVVVPVEGSVGLAANEVYAGDYATLQASGFTPNMDVSFELHSKVYDLGTVTADATGTATLKALIPTEVSAGKHTVIAKQGDTQADTTITVYIQESPNPGEDPTTPGEDPVTPGEEPTTPGEDPVAPGDEPVTPGDEPTTPGDEPVAPGDEPTTPNDEPVAPGEDPVAPGEEPTTPGDEPVAPGEDPVTPGDDATTPSADTTTPGGTDASNTGNTNSGTPTPSASASTSSQLPRTGTDALPLVFATMILLAAGGTLITIRRRI